MQVAVSDFPSNTGISNWIVIIGTGPAQYMMPRPMLVPPGASYTVLLNVVTGAYGFWCKTLESALAIL